LFTARRNGKQQVWEYNIRRIKTVYWGNKIVKVESVPIIQFVIIFYKLGSFLMSTSGDNLYTYLGKLWNQYLDTLHEPFQEKIRSSKPIIIIMWADIGKHNEVWGFKSIVYCSYGVIFNTAVFQYVEWRNYKQKGSCQNTSRWYKYAALW
jgi:hypothetical protein